MNLVVPTAVVIMMMMMMRSSSCFNIQIPSRTLRYHFTRPAMAKVEKSSCSETNGSSYSMVVHSAEEMRVLGSDCPPAAPLATPRAVVL